VGRKFLDGGDQLRAVESGHGHVGDHEIDAALLETLEGFFAARETGHAVAAGLKHDFAIGERLFVVVNTKDGAFRFHPPPEIRGPPAGQLPEVERKFSLFAKNGRAKESYR